MRDYQVIEAELLLLHFVQETRHRQDLLDDNDDSRRKSRQVA